MRVKVPGSISISNAAWALMESHRVGEGCIEELVVTFRNFFEDRCKILPFPGSQLCHPSDVPRADHENFKGPSGPEGNDGDE